MDGHEKTKRSPVLFFLVAFAALGIVMIVVNRQSALEQELRFPFNNGIASLSTCTNLLVAAGLDDTIYVWDWNNLSAKPASSETQSHYALLLGPDKVISLRQRGLKAVVISNFSDGHQLKLLPIDSQGEVSHLTVSRQRTVAAFVVKKPTTDGDSAKVYELLSFTPDAQKIEKVIEFKTSRPNDQLADLALSDDGKLAVVVGQKDNRAWIALADISEKRVVREADMPQPRLFHDSALSPDGRLIYVRGSDSTVYAFEVASGRVASRFAAFKDSSSEVESTSVQQVTVSPDGKLIAAIVSTYLCVWDSISGQKLLLRTPGHKIESGLAFSPDGRFVATSDMRQGGTIKIWRCPSHR